MKYLYIYPELEKYDFQVTEIWNLWNLWNPYPKIIFIVWKNNWLNTWQVGLQNGIFATWAMRERKQCFSAQKAMFYDSQSVGLFS